MFSQMEKKVIKQFIIFGIFFLIVISILSGCTSDTPNEEDISNEVKKFIGRWTHGTIQGDLPLEFKSNGDCNYLGEDAVWEIKGGVLIINFVNVVNELTFDFEFLDDNKTLILTEISTGQVDDYKKQ